MNTEYLIKKIHIVQQQPIMAGQDTKIRKRYTKDPSFIPSLFLVVNKLGGFKLEIKTIAFNVNLKFA